MSNVNAQNFIDETVDSIILTPVNLQSFNAFKIEKNVDLNWSTASEINSKQFIIQRSLNGNSFENLAIVKSAGNSNSTINYKYTDLDVPNANLYYRLQQEDFDGKASFSSIILVKYSKQNNIEFGVYPNPIKNGNLTVTLRNIPTETYSLSLKNIIGKTIFTSTLNQVGTISTNLIQLPKTLSKGFYMLNIINISGNINLTEKIIIE